MHFYSTSLPGARLPSNFPSPFDSISKSLWHKHRQAFYPVHSSKKEDANCYPESNHLSFSPLLPHLFLHNWSQPWLHFSVLRALPHHIAVPRDMEKNLLYSRYLHMDNHAQANYRVARFARGLTTSQLQFSWKDHRDNAERMNTKKWEDGENICQKIFYMCRLFHFQTVDM